MNRCFSSVLPSFLLFGLLSACPAPEPPPKEPAPPPPTEADAKVALEKAKAKNDAQVYLEVFEKYYDFPSGKSAARLACRRFFEDAIASAEKCKIPDAEGFLQRTAPYTANDRAIDAAYDETRKTINREKVRCVTVKLDEDLKKAEEVGDYSKAFLRILGEKEVEGISLNARRVSLVERWRAFITNSFKSIVEKKSIADALGDKKDGWLNSIHPEKILPELGSEAARYHNALPGIQLLFDKLKDSLILEPPTKRWTINSAKGRTIENPSGEGKNLPDGIVFTAIAQGKLNGEMMFISAKSPDGDVLTRLTNIHAFISEKESKPFDTRMLLPDDLIGAKVLAPITVNNDEVLAAAEVLSNDGTNLFVALLNKTVHRSNNRVKTSREKIRPLWIMTGQKCKVYIGGKWKDGEVADTNSDEQVLVRVNGFESYTNIMNIRVNRSEMPTLPSK